MTYCVLTIAAHFSYNFPTIFYDILIKCFSCDSIKSFYNYCNTYNNEFNILLEIFSYIHLLLSKKTLT